MTEICNDDIAGYNRTMTVESTYKSHAGVAIEPLQTAKKTCDLDLRTCRGPANATMDCRSAKLGVVSSSRFAFYITDRKTDKHRQTELSALSPTCGYTASVDLYDAGVIMS